MKHLLNGVAIAAVLAIAAPAWAQTPVPGQPNLTKGIPGSGQPSPSTNNPSQMPPAPAAAPMAPMPMPPTAGHPSHTSGMSKGHHASYKHRHGPAVASTADQLNAQELTRLQGGGAPPPPMPSNGVPGQPSLQQGQPGAGNASPSYHTP